MLYDKNAGVAITIMEVKEKFLPITQYIKPEVLRHVKEKKEIKKMRKFEKGICPDCGKEKDITSQGICIQCRTRKTNAKSQGREYVPYLKLSQHDKDKVDRIQRAHEAKKALDNKEVATPEVKPVESAIMKEVMQPELPKISAPKFNPLSDKASLIATLKECGSEIPDTNLKEVLDVLVATNKLKDLIITITQSKNQDVLLDLEQMLNVAERKLQHNWEYNGFQEIDDIKFKGFLTWRRALKGAIYFWKKLYSTNTIVELEKSWTAYMADPNEKTTMAGERTESILKRYQITTETISTIFNTKKPFTRVFYAVSQDDAYDKLIKWLNDRQLHEDKSKTKIVELKSEGVDGRKV